MQEKKAIKNIKKIWKGMEDCNPPNNQILVLQTLPSPKKVVTMKMMKK
jgi:hypothetical protein